MPLSSAEIDHISPLEAAHERALADQLEAAVTEKTGKCVRDLRIHFRDGVAVITGSASSYYAKQLATHAIPRGIRISNEIEVQ